MWEFYNGTADAHPMHIHEVLFEVVNRQDILVDEGEPATVRGRPRVAPAAAGTWETGYKDTVIAYPGQVTRVRMRFSTPGQFIWHCHIVSHEDNEMMRPYRIGPDNPTSPEAEWSRNGQGRPDTTKTRDVVGRSPVSSPPA